MLGRSTATRRLAPVRSAVEEGAPAEARRSGSSLQDGAPARIATTPADRSHDRLCAIRQADDMPSGCCDCLRSGVNARLAEFAARSPDGLETWTSPDPKNRPKRCARRTSRAQDRWRPRAEGSDEHEVESRRRLSARRQGFEQEGPRVAQKTSRAALGDVDSDRRYPAL